MIETLLSPEDQLAQLSSPLIDTAQIQRSGVDTASRYPGLSPTVIRQIENRAPSQIWGNTSIATALPGGTAEPSIQANGYDSNQAALLDAVTKQLASSIRANICSLHQTRQRELFDDFASAVLKQDVNYMADTILNWAFGGLGYRYAAVELNSTFDDIPPLSGSLNDRVWDAIESEHAANNRL